MRYWVFGFIVSFILVVTRHTGVGNRYVIGLRIIEERGIFERVWWLVVGWRDLLVAREGQPARQPFIRP